MNKGHSLQRFDEDIRAIQARFLAMGGLVERQLEESVDALAHGDDEKAGDVVHREHQINRMEVEVDRDCELILARHHPVAGDLRLVIAIMKASTDLERIGDEAEKVARMCLRGIENEAAPLLRGPSFSRASNMASKVRTMVREALDAFARLDAEAAYAVCREDKHVNQEYDAIVRQCITFMMEDPRSISRAMVLMWVVRSLERIGDHARNISEYVIFQVGGEDIRHGGLGHIEDAARSAATRQLNEPPPPEG